MKQIIQILFMKHMKMFRFKFDKNRTKNEEFDLFEGRGEDTLKSRGLKCRENKMNRLRPS